MNRRTTVPILLACAFALLAPPPVFADYFGVEVVERTDLTICQNTSEPDIPQKLDVCEVHVVFDDPTDRLISVAFTNVSTTAPQGFYQHTLGGDTAPACASIALEPTLECDSFVTLGVDCFDLIDNSTSDPDFDSTGFNSSGEASGGWYNSAPSNGQGAPDANGRVLIGRFSYKQNKTTSGDVCIFTQLGGGSGDIIEFLLEPFDCSNPGMQGGGGGGGCPAGTVRYVDDTATGENTGLNWTDAFTDLQTALDLVSSGDQIWVAAGTYKPTKRTEQMVARTEAFALASCLKIYGGFFGNEDPATFNLDDRDFVANETILSGDIGTQNDDSDNCYHVVSAGSSSSVDATAILDGFTVTKGNANGTFAGANGPDQGSAVNIWINSTPKLENCTFRQNSSNFHAAVNDHGGATLIDCVFRENHSADWAGGLYVHTSIGTKVTRCDFYLNTAVNDGGGVYVKSNTAGLEPTFQDCIFSGNSANEGGGFYSGAGRSPSISDCTFSGNVATAVGKGAAIYVGEDSEPLIEGCTFTSNVGGTCGAAIYMGVSDLSIPKIRDCKFVANSGVIPGALYGGAIYSEGATAEFVNCVFQDNAARAGGAIYQLQDLVHPENDPSMDLINCTFINNKTTDDPQIPGNTAGGAIASKNGPLLLTNCLFVGNRATSEYEFGIARGGAVSANASTQLTATNCTFVGNSAKTDGGGIRIGVNPASNKLDNCVFWNNTDNNGNNDDESAQIYFQVAAPAVTYSDLMNVVPEGSFCATLCGVAPDEYCCNGNIGDDVVAHDPKFVDPLHGTWTADGVYCSQACMDAACSDCDGLEVGQSMFTDGNATYTADEHVGKLLNPNTTQGRVALIAANTPTTVTVWGDLTAIGGNTDPYRIDDYRLDSSAGSPCIDAADNNVVALCGLDLDGKERFFDDPATSGTGLGSPEHPLDFVDMGAYEFGGDPELDCDGNGLADSCCPADFNSDEIVNAFDLATLLGSWGGCSDCEVGVPDCNCRADFNADCTVGAFDLGQLLGSWGPCQ